LPRHSTGHSAEAKRENVSGGCPDYGTMSSFSDGSDRTKTTWTIERDFRSKALRSHAETYFRQFPYFGPAGHFQRGLQAHRSPSLLPRESLLRGVCRLTLVAAVLALVAIRPIVSAGLAASFRHTEDASMRKTAERLASLGSGYQSLGGPPSRGAAE
jgi:hypothetical protein